MANLVQATKHLQRDCMGSARWRQQHLGKFMMRVPMSLRPPSTCPSELDTTGRANLAHHASRPNASDVSVPLNILPRATADREAESTVVSLLERAGDASAHRRRDTRRLLAIGYLRQGDVDGAVSLACDMLCHPAPAGFRSLLYLLLQFGQPEASATNGDRRGACPDSLHQYPIPGHLSAKEIAVLRLMGRGHSNKSIARELNVAPETVKCHAKRIFFKLSTHTRAEAVARASVMGIL
jgi:ATP/maltotriose-dependent transcriptional regulator MalT